MTRGEITAIAKGRGSGVDECMRSGRYKILVFFHNSSSENIRFVYSPAEPVRESLDGSVVEWEMRVTGICEMEL